MMGHSRTGKGVVPLWVDKERKTDRERRMEHEMGSGSGGEDREVGEAQREKVTEVFFKKEKKIQMSLKLF